MEDRDTQRQIEIGRRALLADNPGGALEPLRRALTNDPENAEAHRLLAMALYGLHRLSAALVEANAAMLGDAENADTHAVLGDIHYGMRDLKTAKRHYEAAREFGPLSVGPLRGLAAVAAFYDDEVAAFDLLREALALDASDVEVLVDIANLHLLRGRLDEAARFVDEALAVEAHHRAGLCVKGFVLLRRGDVAGAREHCVWALRRDPTHLDAIKLLAAVKVRENVALGLWFRVNGAVSSLGPRAGTAMVAAYVGQALLRLVLQDLGYPTAGDVVRWVWLGICHYSYAAPQIFQRMIAKEIDSVVLRGDY